MGFDLGKIQLQKIIYFLQESDIPLKYNYEIYHYGPYCFELAGNLDSLNSSGVLDVTPDNTGYGYHIVQGKFSDNFYGKDLTVTTNKYKKQIDFVLANFASCTVSEIELKATIHFVHKMLTMHEYHSKEDIVRRVQELKPKFTPKYISDCYDELNKIIPLN